jgi:CRP-like cAMP-binding protein
MTGEVKVENSYRGSGDVQIISILGPGRTFGERGLLTYEPRMLTIRAG